MRILRAGDHKRMPWKNGKGETVEIAVFPPDASINDFDWRISMATVAEDGPFSIFPGIDRTLAILDGNGMVLDVAGTPVLLTTASDPRAFPADVSVAARLEDGAITDLNVMTRRDGLAHTLFRIDVDGSKTVQLPPSTCLLLCHRGTLSFRRNGETGTLAAGDALLIEATTATALEIDGEARCYLASITTG
ncbi:HutD family protein (plasmid) [Rhizobium leguminosarum bv. trifolii]|uniref:HutD/Ves family protein n=1 Tax=Rhizobium ruizarguesonis TaxID=2081791 RepID=UPI001031C26C|nr:HutD family protein [Rhizobium ruizarguesonis]MBY5807134.1 HutD family protein [Rhizobium leguminosarum]QIO48243.1 HutD family protein [Rhizobium leguminosarum bv. trifolii]NEH35670.1 HutD family protein [Rhizobium ruizarguesonis]NEJ09278.1 HutD family protein [Rhizobium ruizarguesonis]NEJ97691.1 HutD family protein [Rhizobium ruizarguesonis]